MLIDSVSEFKTNHYIVNKQSYKYHCDRNSFALVFFWFAQLFNVDGPALRLDEQNEATKNQGA